MENGSFFAASGFRNLSDYALALVGTYGYYWIACPDLIGSGQAGFYLYFYSGTVLPRASIGRAYGFPVLAIVEETREQNVILDCNVATLYGVANKGG